MTVSISYSPSALSSVSRSRMSPRTTFTRSRPPVRTNSLCGTQSRTRQTTSAPASRSRFTSHEPTSPVPPVTKVGRSSQKARFSPIFSMADFLPPRVGSMYEHREKYPCCARNHGEERHPIAPVQRGFPVAHAPRQFVRRKCNPQPRVVKRRNHRLPSPHLRQVFLENESHLLR